MDLSTFIAAIPSLYLNHYTDIPMSSGREERINTRNTVKETLLNQSEVNPEQSCTEMVSNSDDNMENVEENYETKYKNLLSNYNKLRQKQLLMKNNIKQKFLENKQLKLRLCNRNKMLQVEMKKNKNVKKLLQPFLNRSQWGTLLHNKKSVIWSSDDISKAFTIRYLSKQCYVYLRETLRYCLPHINTLQRWASKLKLRNGLLCDVLRLMKIAALTNTEYDRVTVLHFEEMKVRSLYEYDVVEDQIVGPHGQMLVVMVRGLFKNWKQPVYINFDQKMTCSILIKVITELNKISYNVVACVSNCGEENIRLWEEMGLSVEQCYFWHPVTNQKIFYFADALHILKLVRNWLLDTGFCLKDGSEVRKDPLVALVSSADSKISSCHRLNENHIYCEKLQRQDVHLASQLLSNTTATALLHCKPGMNKKLTETTGNFIQQINAWFDIMNSVTPTASMPSKRPYGIELDTQNETLDKVYDTICNMRCNTKRSLQVFQKGMLMSINSLKQLFSEMKNKFQITYIITNRLTQNSLENLFSQVRSHDELNDHPTPLDSIYRIRMIILGKKLGLSQHGTNTNTQVTDNEYIVSNILTVADVSADEPIAPVKFQIPLQNESTSSPSSSDRSTNDNTTDFAKIVEDDGVKCLCWWIAKKFREKYAYLGKPTCKKETYSYTNSSLIQHLPYGELIEPSEKWVSQAHKLNSYFLKYNKGDEDRLKLKPKLVKDLCNKLSKKYPDIPSDIIQTFIKHRIFIHIQYLNTKIVNTRKRKFNDDESYRRQTKDRKII